MEGIFGNLDEILKSTFGDCILFMLSLAWHSQFRSAQLNSEMNVLDDLELRTFSFERGDGLEDVLLLPKVSNLVGARCGIGGDVPRDVCHAFAQEEIRILPLVSAEIQRWQAAISGAK